jgi:hypothetical protein
VKLGTTDKERLYTLAGSCFYLCADFIGNVYFGDQGSNQILKWSSSSGVIEPIDAQVSSPLGVAADRSGNVYFSDLGTGQVKKWSPVTRASTAVASGYISAVAVDQSGNIYLQPDTILKLVNAFVDVAAWTENALAGSDQLAPILPLPQYMTNAFSPTSSEPWLTVTGTTNGIVSFRFEANTTGAARTAYINVLGQNVPVTQGTNASPVLSNARLLPNGEFQFSFTHAGSAPFTVLSTTNLATPFNEWSVVGTATNLGHGALGFAAATGSASRFFRVRSE